MKMHTYRFPLGRPSSVATLSLSFVLFALTGPWASGGENRANESVNDRRSSPPPSSVTPSEARPSQPSAPSPSPSSSFRQPPPDGGRGPGGTVHQHPAGPRPGRNPGDYRGHRPAPGSGEWNRPRPGDSTAHPSPHRPDFGRPRPDRRPPGGRPDEWAGRPTPHRHHPRPVPAQPYYYGPYWSGYYYWYGDYYFWGGYSYSPYRDYFFWDRYPYAVRDDGEESTENALYFFPPNPPPLGAPLPIVVWMDSSNSAPGELAAFVNEPFYAQLGTQLSRKMISHGQLDEFQAYHNAKLREAELLNAKLAETAKLDPSARNAALETFAKEQTPRLAALEAQAEKFRSQLLPKGLARMFVGSFNWLERRDWTLSSPSIERLGQEEAAAFQFQTMRAFSYYQDGLSPAFRRLLREAALDLQTQAFSGGGSADDDPDETVVFFSPEMAQVRLTRKMPEALATKFAAYADERRGLRDELVDALVRIDGANSAMRLETVRRITAALAPRLEALEEKADAIRAETASQLSVFEPTFDYPLPEEIRAKLEAFAVDEQALRRRVTDEYARLSSDSKEGKFSLSISSVGYSGTNSLAIVMAPRLGATDEKIRNRAAQVREFNAATRSLSRELDERRSAMKNELAAYFRKDPEAAKDSSSADVLDDFEDYSRKVRVWELYRPYFAALFEQGLSLEQRRLLFDIGVENLKLPLPFSE